MKTVRFVVFVAVVFAVGAILGLKAWQGKASPLPPAELTLEGAHVETSPGTLLLFNRNMGCICVLKLYAAADSYFNKMAPELTAAFHAQRINADESPELVEAHRVIVAPTVIVLDGQGVEVLRHEGKIKWDIVEAKLREMLAQEGKT